MPSTTIGPTSPAPAAAQPPRPDADTRPHDNLLVYYSIASLVLGPFFWALLIPGYFRFRTLRYDFDDEGVTMRWGILFRREISLTYARIQDIHLSSNVVERWLGLAKIKVQTASGNASAEMTIEGLQEFEQVRDFLYLRMRGVRQTGGAAPARPVAPGGAAALGPAAALDGETAAALAEALRETAHELRALRAALRPDARAEPGDA